MVGRADAREAAQQRRLAGAGPNDRATSRASIMLMPGRSAPPVSCRVDLGYDIERAVRPEM
nr:hypothetical protein GCM10020063_045870 [Dactylosporangium thailandense]